MKEKEAVTVIDKGSMSILSVRGLPIYTNEEEQVPACWKDYAKFCQAFKFTKTVELIDSIP